MVVAGKGRNEDQATGGAARQVVAGKNTRERRGGGKKKGTRESKGRAPSSSTRWQAALANHDYQNFKSNLLVFAVN